MPEEETDIVIELEKALALTYDAKAEILKARRQKPDKDTLRDLNKTMARLEIEQADLEELIDAYEDEPDDLPMPDPALVKEIAVLTGKVEKHAKKNATAKQSLAVASNVLEMAIKATANRGAGG